MAARSPAICRPPPRRLGHLQASSPNRTSQHGPPGTGSCTQQLANWRQQILLRTNAPIQRQASGHATAVSPNGGKIFLPTSPPVDPCAFGLCSGSATATNHAPRACTLTNRWSKAVVTAPATPATNPSLFSTGSMRPSHVVLISHAIPCSTGSMYSSLVILINHTTKFFPLTYLSERGTASPHAPRAHPRPPPAPRQSATSFLHFFAPHVKYPATGLTFDPD